MIFLVEISFQNEIIENEISKMKLLINNEFFFGLSNFAIFEPPPPSPKKCLQSCALPHSIRNFFVKKFIYIISTHEPGGMCSIVNYKWGLHPPLFDLFFTKT